MRSCPRRLDRRIQREDVRLERDLIDDLNDLRDIRRRDVDGLHRAQHLLHLLVPVLRLHARLARELVRVVRVLRVALGLRGNLGDGRRELLDGGRLLGRAL